MSGYPVNTSLMLMFRSKILHTLQKFEKSFTLYLTGVEFIISKRNKKCCRFEYMKTIIDKYI